MPYRRIVSACAIAVGAISTVAVVTAGYSIAVDKPYLQYKNLPFPTKQLAVKAGQVMPLQVERCNTDSVPHNYSTSHAMQNLVTRESYILPEAIVNIMPGCTSSESRVNRLPDNVTPGKYRLFGIAEIQGRFTTHFVEWHSQPFEVVQ